MTQDIPRGVLLLAFGGPDSPEAIEPFMTNLMGGRKPPPPVVEKVKERYRLIGGKSPLPETTNLQAKALEEKLCSEGSKFKAYVGMRYWHPFIYEAINQMLNDGVKEVVAVSLSPHYAGVSTGAYVDGIEEALKNIGANISISMSQGWYDHPLYIEALAENITVALESIPVDKRSDTLVIFSAHSLPLSHIKGGDPYVDQINTTISLLIDKLNIKNWQLAYQSKGGGQEPWLGPEVKDVMSELNEKDLKDVLVVPVSFATDHIETLYDIDILQRKHAEALGLNFARASALNLSPKFIAALADVARKEINKQ